jgi:putative tryptophan/tyrosine transport system substrate-binding protein
VINLKAARELGLTVPLPLLARADEVLLRCASGDAVTRGVRCVIFIGRSHDPTAGGGAMRRREFITLIGGAAAWPLAAQAQRSHPMRRIGILADEQWPPIDSLKQGLRMLGYVEGQNLEIVYRFAAGQAERYPGLAAELVALPVEVIVALGTPASVAAKRATEAIPIVVQTGDPVAAGLVRDLAHPGGNVTGFSGQAADAEGKRLELLKELLPSLSRVAILVNPANSLSAVFLDNARSGATTLGLRLDAVEASSVADLERALTALRSDRPDAVLVTADRGPLMIGRTRIAEFLTTNRLPSISSYVEHVQAGGLMAYAASYHATYRRNVALVIDKIFKGTKPGDLPVQQPTEFELILNLKTAKALGLTMPPTLLARADEVIE